MKLPDIMYADGISSVLHGLAVLIPAFGAGMLLGPVAQIFVAGIMFGFYAVREYKDFTAVNTRYKTAKLRKEKRADAIRDLFFPFLATVIAVGAVAL